MGAPDATTPKLQLEGVKIALRASAEKPQAPSQYSAGASFFDKLYDFLLDRRIIFEPFYSPIFFEPGHLPLGVVDDVEV